MVSNTKELSTTKLSNPLNIDDLSKISLDGDGVLDKFLRLHRLILDREYDAGRIQGKEYADTFVRTYATNMELAIKFLLDKEKQYYEIELIESQIANSKKDLELKEYELTHIKPVELAALTANKELTEQKIITEKAQTDATAYGPESVIDWNVKTLEAQIAGIEQESKQKIMRMLISTWETRLNNDGVDNPSTAGLGDTDIKQAVDAAKSSVGI